jgi:hypothetical protein
MRNALFVRAFILCVLYVRAVHVPRISAAGRISTLLGAKASLVATAERKRSTGTASRMMIFIQRIKTSGLRPRWKKKPPKKTRT